MIPIYIIAVIANASLTEYTKIMPFFRITPKEKAETYACQNSCQNKQPKRNVGKIEGGFINRIKKSEWNKYPEKVPVRYTADYQSDQHDCCDDSK